MSVRLASWRGWARLAGAAARRLDARVAAAVLLLAVALALPPIALNRPSYAYLVAFDITQSMDVEDAWADGRPASRLEAARAAMRAALPGVPCGSKIGWAVFADYRTLVLLQPVEVCRHYEELLAALARIDGRMRWANASNVGKGITWAVRGARDAAAGTNVVMFTDGQEAPPLREGETPPMADLRPGEVRGWIVGVGGDRAEPIPRSGPDGERLGTWRADEVVQRPGLPAGVSQEHLSSLQEDHLRQLARRLGLDYLRLGDEPGPLLRALTEPQLARDAPARTELGALPAALALLLLAWRHAPGMPLDLSKRGSAARGSSRPARPGRSAPGAATGRARWRAPAASTGPETSAGSPDARRSRA
jgi:mxaL protein